MYIAIREVLFVQFTNYVGKSQTKHKQSTWIPKQTMKHCVLCTHITTNVVDVKTKHRKKIYCMQNAFQSFGTLKTNTPEFRSHRSGLVGGHLTEKPIIFRAGGKKSTWSAFVTLIDGGISNKMFYLSLKCSFSARSHSRWSASFYCSTLSAVFFCNFCFDLVAHNLQIPRKK